MSLYLNKYRIESARMKGWDYSNTAYYFVTICIKNRMNILGKIENDEMILNNIGKIIESEWLMTKIIRKNIELDEYKIMPNHFHAIIFINNDNIGTVSCRDALQCVSTGDSAGTETKYGNRQNLSNIIRGFKGATTKKIHIAGHEEFEWQSRFYDRIIRDENELDNVRKYIRYNPSKWNEDEYFEINK
jgi:REP element-mobilizing transposase RayT